MQSNVLDLNSLNIPNSFKDVTVDVASKICLTLENMFNRSLAEYERLYVDDIYDIDIDINKKLILLYSVIIKFLSESGVNKEWLNLTANKCSEELFDEFSNLGFGKDNPFINFLKLSSNSRFNTINSISDDDYAIIHNSYADDLISYKDLNGIGIFKFTNIIFNKSFYTRIRSYNDKLYLLKIQDRIRPETIKGLLSNLDSTFSEVIMNCKDTSEFTKFEIIDMIFLYNNKILNQTNYNIVDYEITEGATKEVKTALEMKNFLSNLRDFSQETETNIVNRQKLTKLPNDLDENVVEGIVRFIAERVADADINDKLSSINPNLIIPLTAEERTV